MDDPGRLALATAMELAGRVQGPSWGADAIVSAAERFRLFLDGEPESITILRSHAQAINDLHERLDMLEKGGSSRTKRVATNTTPPDSPVEF